MKIQQAHHANRNNDTTGTNCGKRRCSPFLFVLSYLLIEQQQQQVINTVSYTIPIIIKRRHATTTTTTTTTTTILLNPSFSSTTTITRRQYNNPSIYFLQSSTSSFSSSSSISFDRNSNKNNIIASKLNINDRFGRWKYLQTILDEDEEIDYNNDIRSIICILLEKWLLTHPQHAGKNNDDNNIPDNTYKTINELLIQLYKNNSSSNDNSSENDNNNNIFNNNNDTTIIEKLQLLLPDPIQDEDAYKSVWDTIIELHGRESVKINERNNNNNNNSNWKIRCIIARILLQYDFLTQGI